MQQLVDPDLIVEFIIGLLVIIAIINFNRVMWYLVPTFIHNFIFGVTGLRLVQVEDDHSVRYVWKRDPYYP